MPSLARVMPVISLFIALFPSNRYLDAFSSREPVSTSLENALGCLIARGAILGVTVAIILEHLLDNLGLEFAIGTFGDLGQVEILNRIAVGIKLETAAQRREVGLFQGRRHGLLVGKVALDRLDGAINQHRRVIGLEGVGAGHAVVGGLVGSDEFLVLRIVEIGRPVRAAEHADGGVLLSRKGGFVDGERREDWNLIGEAGLPVLLHQAYAHAARHEGKHGIGLQRRDLGEFNLEIQRTQRHVGLLDNLSLVVEFESGSGILTGLIVWNQQGDALVGASLGDLAGALVHLIVLVGGHVEKRTAVLAGVARRACIRADQKGL